jgi:hypothetical protein
MAKHRIEYEAVAVEEDSDEYVGLILRIDDHEFTLDKTDVSYLGGIVTAVYDFIVDPFDAYLREGLPVRVAGTPGPG